MGGSAGNGAGRAENGRPLPLEQRARLAIALLLVVALADVFAVWTDIGQVDLLNKLVDGERVTFAEADQSDDRVATGGIIQLVAYVLSIIAFLLWYSRAYRNVLAMNELPGRYGTRWAVWYWFIPIANLFRPKEIVNDIWRGSDPDARVKDREFYKRPLIPLLAFWWATWLIANVVSRMAIRSLDSQTAQELRTQGQIYLVADALDLIAALLAAAVVWKLTERQELRRQRYEQGMLTGQRISAEESAESAPPSAGSAV